MSSLATAVAAVVIAVLVWPHSNATGSNSSQRTDQAVNHVSSQSSSSVSLSASASESTATSASASGSDPIQWHGHVLITVNEVDLDSVPVNNGASTQVSLYDTSSGLGNTPYQFTALPFGAATLAVWSGSTAPTRAQCYDQVASQGVNVVSVSNGTMVCVITAMDRVALLKVLDDQADSGNGILTDVTVWSRVISTASASVSSN
jgi:hypothetical protein